jgi:hypothetical protein
MLLYQGCIAFEIWTGLAAPVEEMRKALGQAVFRKQAPTGRHDIAQGTALGQQTQNPEP